MPGTSRDEQTHDDDGVRILVVDDEETFGRSLGALLERRRARVSLAFDGASGLRALRAGPFDIVLLDHVLPDCRGLDLVASIQACRPQPLVIMMTAYGTVDDAVEAMRRGAHDYIPKGADVRPIVERVQRARALVAARRGPAVGFEPMPPLLGVSAAMDEVRARVARVARSPETTVLFTGESGTGKELAARTLHALGPGAERPFVAVDCVSLPATLAESELFGHERGAFTGAERARPGKLESADGGTLLLDEIGDMDLGLQAKLLRVLEDRTMTRIGGQRSTPLRARVVAATNTDLAARVSEGRFRLDLFHRLSVFQVTMPPLRTRREDVPGLIDHFLGDNACRLGAEAPVISERARALLVAYDYPGNVRELRNILEQASIMVEDGRVDVEHLPDRLRELRGYLPVASPARADAILVEFVPGRDSLASLEDRLVDAALERTGGQVTRAAALLGISRFALSRRLAKRKGE